MFGLGLQEILILLIPGILGLVLVCFIVWAATKKPSHPGNEALEDENRRLTQENERLKAAADLEEENRRLGRENERLKRGE
jgi:hypothetical protein